MPVSTFFVRRFFKADSSLSSQRKALLAEFQKKAGIKFKNQHLLDNAFYHRSFVNETAGNAIL